MITYTPIPVLFSIGNVKIYSFGVMLALAFLLPFILARRKAEDSVRENIDNLTLLSLMGGIVGARIGYIILNFKQFTNPFEFFRIWGGGLTSYAGILGAFLLVSAYSKIKRLNLLEIMDFVVPYAALGFAIGRIGCFLNWDDYGKATEFALAFVVGKTPRHPTQIYLIVANLILFGLLYAAYERNKKILKPSSPQLGFLHKKGFIFLLFLLLYSLINFIIDFLRYYPAEQYFFGFALTQWIALSILLIAGVSLAARSR